MVLLLCRILRSTGDAFYYDCLPLTVEFGIATVSFDCSSAFAGAVWAVSVCFFEGVHSFVVGIRARIREWVHLGLVAIGCCCRVFFGFFLLLLGT